MTLWGDAALAGALGVLIEADEHLELAGTRAFGDVEGHRAHGREIADGVIDGDGGVDAHRIAGHPRALGIGDSNIDAAA